MLTLTLAAMDSTIVSTAVPQIVADLGGFRLFSWLFSVYLLGQTITIPIYGKLADTFGRKRVLIFGMLLFLVGSAACALAWDMASLIGFRGLQGLGAGAIMATVNTLAGDIYTVRERARVQGWLSSVWGMAAVVGPTLGGSFVEYASWRWIFLVNLPIGLLAMGLIDRFLDERPRGERHQIDYAGALLLMLAVAALLLGLLQGGQSWPWLSPPSLAAFLAALLLGGLLPFVERRAREPIQPPWLWRRAALIGTNLAMIAMGLVMMGPNTYLPTYGQAVLGLGPIAAGLLLACISLGWPLASSLSGKLYLRIGFRDTGLCGAVLLVLATAGFLLLSPRAGAAWLAVDQVLLGAGFGLLSTPLLVGVQSMVGWGQRGVVTGANLFSRYLGQCLGAAMAGAIFNGAMRDALARAPAGLAAILPSHPDEVLRVLESPGAQGALDAFLRLALADAMRWVYLGLLVAALALTFVLFLTPRRFGMAGADVDAGRS